MTSARDVAGDGGAGDGFDVRSLACTYRDGRALPAHRHPWGQLVYACSGVLHVDTDGQLWLVPPTRAIWIPHGVAHAISVRGESAMRTLYIAPARASGIERGQLDVGA